MIYKEKNVSEMDYPYYTRYTKERKRITRLEEKKNLFHQPYLPSANRYLNSPRCLDQQEVQQIYPISIIN